MDINRTFIRFLGELVFSPEKDSWHQLTQLQQQEYCRTAQQNRLGMLFAEHLREDLPEPYRQMFQESLERATLQWLFEENSLKKFYHLLETEKIPFVPVKGVDLAFRIYPDPAFRPHGDWDILFHQEDCPEVIRLLQEDGWKSFSGYTPKKTDHYHYERMHNDHYCLEAHHILPHFGSASAEEIWNETEKLTEYHRVLTPEISLLLISAHASGNFYTHESEWKILMDAGMILKHDAVDWEKVHCLADRWGILRPDILFHVWSDFFPEGCLPPEDPQNKQYQLIRDIFGSRDVMQGHSAYERRLAIREKHDFRWLLDRFKFYTPASICLKYHIPPHQNGKIILYGLKNFFEKIWFLLTCFRSRDPEFRSYCRKVAELDKLIKREQ